MLTRIEALKMMEEMCSNEANKEGGCFWVYTGSINMRLRWGKCTPECASLHDCKGAYGPIMPCDAEAQ